MPMLGPSIRYRVRPYASFVGEVHSEEAAMDMLRLLKEKGTFEYMPDRIANRHYIYQYIEFVELVLDDTGLTDTR